MESTFDKMDNTDKVLTDFLNHRKKNTRLAHGDGSVYVFDLEKLNKQDNKKLEKKLKELGFMIKYVATSAAWYTKQPEFLGRK